MINIENTVMFDLCPLLLSRTSQQSSAESLDFVLVVKLQRDGLGRSYVFRVKWSNLVNCLEKFWLAADNDYVLLSVSLSPS